MKIAFRSQRRRRTLDEERDEDADGQPGEADRRDRLRRRSPPSSPFTNAATTAASAEDQHRHVADEDDAVRAPQIRRRARERPHVFAEDGGRELAQLLPSSRRDPRAAGGAAASSWHALLVRLSRRRAYVSERTPSTTSCTAIAREQQAEDARQEAEDRRARRARHPLGDEQRDADAGDRERRSRASTATWPPTPGMARARARSRSRSRPARRRAASRAARARRPRAPPASPPGKSEPRSISSATSISSRPPAIESEPSETCR